MRRVSGSKTLGACATAAALWLAAPLPVSAQETGEQLDAPAPPGVRPPEQQQVPPPPPPGSRYDRGYGADYGGSRDQPRYPRARRYPEAPPQVSPVPVEPEPRYYNAITINPGELLSGVLALQYERGLGDHIALFAGPAFYLYDPPGFDTDIEFGAGGDLGLRFFVTGGAEAPQGFWFGPQTSLLWLRLDDGRTEAKSFGYAIGALVGYTWMWGRFVFSIGGGPAYVHFDLPDGDVSTAGAVGRIAIGVAF